MEEEITLKTVLDHIQAMGAQLRQQMTEVEGRVIKRMDQIEGRLSRLEETVAKNHRNLTQQIDAIDKRLDEIEIESLPQRVTRIEEHLQLSRA